MKKTLRRNQTEVRIGLLSNLCQKVQLRQKKEGIFEMKIDEQKDQGLEITPIKEITNNCSSAVPKLSKPKSQTRQLDHMLSHRILVKKPSSKYKLSSKSRSPVSATQTQKLLNQDLHPILAAQPNNSPRAPKKSSSKEDQRVSPDSQSKSTIRRKKQRSRGGNDLMEEIQGAVAPLASLMQTTPRQNLFQPSPQQHQ